MITKLLNRQLIARDDKEQSRAATPLELFYDLIFVVAIANLAGAFHHSVSENHISQGIISYLFIFSSVWWAWNSYTWFASSFDNKSASFRLATMWQMVGALIIAAGIKKGFEGDVIIIVVGYIVIRMSSVYLWFKAGFSNPELKVTAFKYAFGIIFCQILWTTLAFTGNFTYTFAIAIWAIELAVPYFAETHGSMTKYHPEHIEERFGLLTIIILGESILASVNSISALLKYYSTDLLLVCIGCILTVFSAWWIYFAVQVEHKLKEKVVVFVWGYGHYSFCVCCSYWCISFC